MSCIVIIKRFDKEPLVSSPYSKHLSYLTIPAQQCRNVNKGDRFACEANHVGHKACEEKKCCFDVKAGYWDIACYYPIGKILIIFIVIIITANKQQSWLVTVAGMVAIGECLQ